MNRIQQGDVLLKRIDRLPEGECTGDEQTASRILAYGEVTGHAHRIENEAGTEVVRILGKLYLVAKEEARLRHEEHRPVIIPPGVYEVNIVRETDHLEGVVRQVAD